MKMATAQTTVPTKQRLLPTGPHMFFQPKEAEKLARVLQREDPTGQYRVIYPKRKGAPAHIEVRDEHGTVLGYF